MMDESESKKAQNDMNNVQREVDKIAHQRSFIEEYPKQGTVGKAMKAIGLARRTFYDWLKDPEFNAIYQELKQDRADEIVSRLYKYILDGTDENDKPIKLNQQQLLAAFFLLKAFDPQTFSEKFQMQHTGTDGAPVKVTTVEIHRADSPMASAEEEEKVPDGDSHEV